MISRSAFQTANRLICLIGVLLLGIQVAGCGSSDDVKVYPVKGRVTFAGKPMAGGGSIAFIPTTNQTGKAAGGQIKDDGTYELTTNTPGDGSMPIV